MAGITVVLDFDKTIIEVDSDNWVVDELGATDLFNALLPTMPWNSLMVSANFRYYILCIFNSHLSFLMFIINLYFSTKNKIKLQDRMMRELHAQGKTIEDIKDVLKRVPIHSRIVPAIKTAHALG